MCFRWGEATLCLVLRGPQLLAFFLLPLVLARVGVSPRKELGFRFLQSGLVQPFRWTDWMHQEEAKQHFFLLMALQPRVCCFMRLYWRLEGARLCWFWVLAMVLILQDCYFLRLQPPRPASWSQAQRYCRIRRTLQVCWCWLQGMGKRWVVVVVLPGVGVCFWGFRWAWAWSDFVQGFQTAPQIVRFYL